MADEYINQSWLSIEAYLIMDTENLTLIKKHEAVINCENSLPLPSRKIFNILLFLIKDDIAKGTTYVIREATVLDHLEKSTRDITEVRRCFKLLGSTVIEFDILNKYQDRVNGVGTFLAPAMINKTKRQWEFSFPPNIIDWILNPESVVFLNLSIQQTFSSKHTLALWEVCSAAIQSDDNCLYSIPLDDCRKLTCGSDKQQQYKDFKRRVLKKGLREMTQKSNIQVELYKEIRDGRKVNELIFHIRRKGNDELQTIPYEFDRVLTANGREINEGSEIGSDSLFQKMTGDFGITPIKATDLIESFNEDRIIKNLEYTETQYRKAIKNNKEKTFRLGAYAVSAITKDYAPRQPELINSIKNEHKKIKQTRTENLNAEKTKQYLFNLEIERKFSTLPSDVQNKLKSEYERVGLLGPQKAIFANEGWTSNKIQKAFFTYLAVQVEQGKTGGILDCLNRSR